MCPVGPWLAYSRVKRYLPSAVTIVRLLLLVPLYGFLVPQPKPVPATVVLAIMGFTDFLDGFIARRMNAVTTFGKVIDPTSDRVVLIALAIILLKMNLLPELLILAVLLREVLVAITVLIELAIYRKRVNVIITGKAGTLGLLTGFPAALFARFYAGPAIRSATLAILWISTGLLYGALLSYARGLLALAAGGHGASKPMED